MRYALKSKDGNCFMSKRDCWISPFVQSAAFVSKNARTYKNKARADKASKSYFVGIEVVEVNW